MESSVDSSPAVANSAITFCISHHRQLIVFCEECGLALCDSCLSSATHHNHTFSTLPDECKKQMDALMKKSKEVSINIRKQGKIASQSSVSTLAVIEDTFTKSKDKLDALFKELKGLVEANEMQAFKLLDSHQKRMTEKLTNVKQEMEDIELWTQTEQDPESFSSVLDESKDLENRIETIAKFFVNWEEIGEENRETKIRLSDVRLQSLENSVSAILEQSKACLSCPWEFADIITFDPVTKHKLLRVSDDDRQVTLPAKASLSKQRLPNKPQDTPLNVLAQQSFTVGRHYWEVDVKGCLSWAVGLVGLEGSVEECWDTTSELGHDKRSWMLESDAGSLAAIHNDDFHTVREQENLSLLGIFLDCDKGRLQFYNVLTGGLLHSFAARFGQAMWPVFSILPPMKDGEPSCLVLCDLCERERSERSERPGSGADSGPQAPTDHPGSPLLEPSGPQAPTDHPGSPLPEPSGPQAPTDHPGSPLPEPSGPQAPTDHPGSPLPEPSGPQAPTDHPGSPLPEP